MPRARPIAIAKKTEEISFELPAIERKRISEKAPRMAIEVPSEPLTINITTSTRSGRIVKVIRKFFEVFEVFRWTKAMMRPSAIATAEQIRIDFMSRAEELVSKIELNIFSPFLD